jgi:hypothetical protein
MTKDHGHIGGLLGLINFGVQEDVVVSDDSGLFAG